MHNFTQSEYDVRLHPNILIPKYIYKVRRESYIYWEISRLARGLNRTFTYSNWDEHARMMYHVQLQTVTRISKSLVSKKNESIYQTTLYSDLIFDEKKQLRIRIYSKKQAELLFIILIYIKDMTQIIIYITNQLLSLIGSELLIMHS